MTVAGFRLFLAAAFVSCWAAGIPDEVRAGEPKILNTVIEAAGQDGDMRFYNVTVTIRHDDTGWDHYCDRFEVLDAETGRLLGIRELAHPHEDEQPFTRTLYRMSAPKDVTRVHVRAHDIVHGYEKTAHEHALPGSGG